MRRWGLNSSGSIFLKPGDFWFGEAPAQVYTILGSCIAITLWHPERRIGGMCHYLLPDAELRHSGHGQGRTAGEALALFLDAIRRYGSRPADYQVKLFGGATFFPHGPGQNVTRVAQRNVQVARQLLAQHGFPVLRESVGGRASRKLIFDLDSGDAWMLLGGQH